MRLGLDVDIADHKLDMLKDAAMMCERMKKYCKHGCELCKYNVSRYMKNECASELLKTEASIEHEKRESWELQKNINAIAGWVLVIGIVLLMAKACGG